MQDAYHTAKSIGYISIIGTTTLSYWLASHHSLFSPRGVNKVLIKVLRRSVRHNEFLLLHSPPKFARLPLDPRARRGEVNGPTPTCAVLNEVGVEGFEETVGLGGEGDVHEGLEGVCEDHGRVGVVGGLARSVCIGG